MNIFDIFRGAVDTVFPPMGEVKELSESVGGDGGKIELSCPVCGRVFYVRDLEGIEVCPMCGQPVEHFKVRRYVKG